MRSPRFGWLVAKEVRELLASRACWLLFLLSGLLAGHALLTAVDAYAEMSGEAGGPAALAQGLSPLDGIVIPTLGSLSLVATLLLPFVVIRVVAHERVTGGWKLLAQGPAPVAELLSAKLVTLAIAWLIAAAPAMVGLLLWRAAGNHLDGAEVGSVLVGQLLFAALTVAVATAAAAAMDSEASAAIVALGFTIGTWALDFVGAARGGVMGVVAEYTPAALLRSFEQGLVRWSATLVVVVVAATLIGLAGIWMRLGRTPASKLAASAGVVAVGVALSLGCARIRASADISEDRRNSFSRADQAALVAIGGPLRVEVHLAPEDPRRADLERGVLDKLRRVVPGIDVDYVARTRTGMFEGAGTHYGEVWYEMRGRRAMTRSTAPPIVLETIYGLAGATPPSSADPVYPGYPMVRRPAHAGIFLLLGWPLLLLVGLVGWRRFDR